MNNTDIEKDKMEQAVEEINKESKELTDDQIEQVTGGYSAKNPR